MIELGLQRISRLLANTPLPWRAIHVAGTNGKGSICAYISGMLDAYNTSEWRKRKGQPLLKHARYTSPHLVDRWDCITLNQKTVPSAVFHGIETKVLHRNAKEAIGASEFEILTATAFEIFTQEAVDVGVVEVGMGGRLDATNIIGQTQGLDLPTTSFDASQWRPPPLVTAVSSIGLDHQAFLGNTIRDIAKEKAGIMKPGVPNVYYHSNTDDDVFYALRNAAMQKLNPLIDSPLQENLQRYLVECFASTKNPPQPNVAIPWHTQVNASIAFKCAWLALQRLDRIPARGIDYMIEQIPETPDLQSLAQTMLHSIATTNFPGRQQSISIEKLTGRKEPILLDGAHNSDSARALAEAVTQLRQQQEIPVTWVLAASDTKDAKEILHPLLKEGDAVYTVEFGPVDGMPWVKALPSMRLLQAAESIIPNTKSSNMKSCGSDVLGALREASIQARGGPLVVAGSLYLVGDVLRLLRGDTASPSPISSDEEDE